jgi:hypothetical protein
MTIWVATQAVPPLFPPPVEVYSGLARCAQRLADHHVPVHPRPYHVCHPHIMTIQVATQAASPLFPPPVEVNSGLARRAQCLADHQVPVHPCPDPLLLPPYHDDLGGYPSRPTLICTPR